MTRYKRGKHVLLGLKWRRWARLGLKEALIGCNCTKPSKQYSRLQYIRLQYSRLQHSRMQYRRFQYGRLQYSKLQYSRLQYSRPQYSRLQYSWLHSLHRIAALFLVMAAHPGHRASLVSATSSVLMLKC